MTASDASRYVRVRCRELGWSYMDIVSNNRMRGLGDKRLALLRELMAMGVTLRPAAIALGRASGEWASWMLHQYPRYQHRKEDFGCTPRVRIDYRGKRKTLGQCACGASAVTVNERDGDEEPVCGACMIRSIKSPQNWARQ